MPTSIRYHFVVARLRHKEVTLTFHICNQIGYWVDLINTYPLDSFRIIHQNHFPCEASTTNSIKSLGSKLNPRKRKIINKLNYFHFSTKDVFIVNITIIFFQLKKYLTTSFASFGFHGALPRRWTSTSIQIHTLGHRR